MQAMNANLFNEFSWLMLLADNGAMVAFLGCAAALFGAFCLARRLFRRLPMGNSSSGQERRGDCGGGPALALQAVKSRLREAGIAEAHIPARLQDAARSLSELRDQLEAVRPEALALVDRGDFEAAAAALSCELRLTPVPPGGRAPDEARRDAELFAAAAEIDQLNLDYRAAADKYDAAARLVCAAEPDASAGALWRFRMAQGRALVDDGAARGLGESLIGAVESYDRALAAVSRAHSPFAWAATQFHRADALLASGVNDNEAGRIEEAVELLSAGAGGVDA